MKKLIFIGLLTISNLVYCQSVGKGIMHISFDDGYGIFRNLTDSADVYSSIFENQFLFELKSLHDSYGAKFSIYCFLKKDDWKLEYTTDKFAGEFSENANWLKFGIHQGLTTENYSNADSATVVSDYEYFLSNIKKIVGNDSASIDVMPRFHNFAGNEASCLAFKGYGFKGFLGADDTRNSYYLTGSATSALSSGDHYYDCKNNLHFFKSEKRLEGVSDINTFLLNFLKTNMAEQAKNLIIFTHEYVCYTYPGNTVANETITKLKACCDFALENNYRFDYPQNIVKDSFCIDGYTDITSEVIQNPGFEDSTFTNDDGYIVPYLWTLNARLTNPDIKLKSEDSFDKNHCYYISGDSTSSIDFFQDIVLTKGQYIVKASLKSNDPSTSFVYVKIGDSIIQTDAIGGTWDSWNAVPVSFIVTSDTTVCVGIFSSQAVMIDDFRILKLIEYDVEAINRLNYAGFNISPNPVESILNLYVPPDFNKGVAKIFDINGKLVLETLISFENTELDVSTFKCGFYLINITNASISWNKRFLVR